MIYSEAFDACRANAKTRGLRRGCGTCCAARRAPARGQRAMAAADRQAIIEILRETKPDLPESFR